MRDVLRIIVAAGVGAFVGSVTTVVLQTIRQPSPATLIREFYATETAVYVSPHTLRKKMDKGETNYVLVDVRSPQEYENEHIVGAINIPAYKDPNTSISLESEREERDRIINAFRTLGRDRDIIVYCYSGPCMTGRKIGKLLAENGIYVKHLGVGWNEWRSFWNLWNHDAETPTDVRDYISTGKQPGKPKVKDMVSPCQVGELGC